MNVSDEIVQKCQQLATPTLARALYERASGAR
jgi:hypothetical protein